MITIDRIDTPNSKLEQRRKEQEHCVDIDQIRESELNDRELSPIQGQRRFEQPLNHSSHCPNWLCRAWRLLTSSIEQTKREG